MWKNLLKVRYIILILIITLMVKILLQDLFDYRPFVFEKYKTNDEFVAAVKERYPVGTDAKKLMDDFEKSRADCYSVDDTLFCDYITSLFSLHPLEEYRIWLEFDSNGKIIEHHSGRFSGLMLIIP